MSRSKPLFRTRPCTTGWEVVARTTGLRPVVARDPFETREAALEVADRLNAALGPPRGVSQ